MPEVARSKLMVAERPSNCKVASMLSNHGPRVMRHRMVGLRTPASLATNLALASPGRDEARRCMRRKERGSMLWIGEQTAWHTTVRAVPVGKATGAR